MLPGWIRRPLHALAATRTGSRLYRWVLPPADRLVARLTGGRRTLTELSLPTLVLTTTGRRSGLPREQPLLYLEEGDGYAVVGSNWGQAHHPAWTHNLLADPVATVRIGGVTTPVRADLLSGEERDRVYARFEALVPNYRRYRGWAGDRQIRVFALHPE